MPPRRRKRGVALLSADTLKNLGMVAGLVVTLWQGWSAGRKADAASGRAKAASETTAAVAALAAGGAGSDSALAERIERLEVAVVKLERRTRHAPKAIGPEPAPAWYAPEPERRGFFARLLGNNDRR